MRTYLAEAFNDPEFIARLDREHADRARQHKQMMAYLDRLWDAPVCKTLPLTSDAPRKPKVKL